MKTKKIPKVSIVDENGKTVAVCVAARTLGDVRKALKRSSIAWGSNASRGWKVIFEYSLAEVLTD